METYKHSPHELEILGLLTRGPFFLSRVGGGWGNGTNPFWRNWRLKRIMFAAIIGISFFVSQSIYGYDEERANAHLASDFAECTAYYIIVAEALRRDAKEVMAHEALEASDRAYIYAIK